MHICRIFFNYQRAKYAARFLKPPGFFKRAEMRERPHRKTGPFENPVKRFVRLREKARLFSLVPPPRNVPKAKIISTKMLQPVEGVPTVDPKVLERRLEFLLGPEAQQQQLSAKLRPGLTPYQAELFTWERQMRDLRKIYRAQYLQKLAQVTEEERLRQYNLHLRQRKDAQERKELILNKALEEKKYRAWPISTFVVSQAHELGRRSRKKIANVYWLSKLATGINYKQDMHASSEEISVPDLARDLGHDIEESSRHKIQSGQLFFRRLLKESFKLMPEDMPRFRDYMEPVSASKRAATAYKNFSESELLQLVEQKIAILNEKIDEESKLDTKCKNSLYIQLRDHLDAARVAYLERENLPDTKGAEK
ncbi:hypothetical protein BdWA1_002045 [Babesia duncani]|uniref:Uncharacterized protein n=1 Tax=Babesia duncani TaxID=323732 RepID=A0AAD9UPB5_9APIC|nr:hypothetical protein BdWA1_003526 [Babesia duncani]KAK2196796.1 hypothetical protein BdWA1_002045 [Babesia duncani]